MYQIFLLPLQRCRRFIFRDGCKIAVMIHLMCLGLNLCEMDAFILKRTALGASTHIKMVVHCC